MVSSDKGHEVTANSQDDHIYHVTHNNPALNVVSASVVGHTFWITMFRNRFALLLLNLCFVVPAVQGIVRATRGETVPLWNTYKWGPNFQGWCRFRCGEKLTAGMIFKIDLSGSTSAFKAFGNLKVLSQNGTSYIVETNYDIWPWSSDGFCQFQFGLTYTGTNLQGNCSFYEPPTKAPKTARGIDVAMWSNARAVQGGLWRYKGRCMIPCSGTYQPGTMRVSVDIDKATTNFNAFGHFTPTIAADSLTRSWTVVNKKPVKSDLGLCQFDMEFDHQSEFPVPKGTCYEI